MYSTYVDGIATLLCDTGDGAEGARGKHNLVFVHERVFVYGSKDVAARDVITNLCYR